MSDTLSHVADSHTEPAVAVAGSKTKPWLGPLVMLLRIVLCLVFGLPLVFLIVSSFKPDNEIFADLGTINAFLPVGSLSLDNY